MAVGITLCCILISLGRENQMRRSVERQRDQEMSIRRTAVMAENERTNIDRREWLTGENEKGKHKVKRMRRMPAPHDKQYAVDDSG